MGFDLTTWSPRRGATGDDQYDLPDDTPIAAGDSAGYSSPPTWAQIDAGTGANQVVAMYNRRANKWNALAGTGMPMLPYFTADSIHSLAAWNLFINRVSALRSSEGFQAVFTTYVTLPVLRTPMRRLMMLEIRKAMRISGWVWRPTTGYGTSSYGWRETSNPYPAAGSRAYSANTTAGKLTGGGTKIYRDRLCSSHAMPEWFSMGAPDPADVPSYAFPVGSLQDDLDNPPNVLQLHLYSSATDDHLYDSADKSEATHLDNWEWGTAVAAVGTIPFPVSYAHVAAHADAYHSFIFGTDVELSGGGVGSGYPRQSRVTRSAAVGPLKIYFGT